MNYQTITPDAAATIGRTAWHTGMNEAQIAAIFRALGHDERAEIARHAIRAFRHLAIDLDSPEPEAPGPEPKPHIGAMDGPTLAAWRERMGYSLRDASTALGCSRSALTGWERGQDIPRYIGLACAALALGMSAYGDEKVSA